MIPPPPGAPVRERPVRVVVPLVDPTTSGLRRAVLHGNLSRVLAGLGFPAQRWQVLTEADFWGVTGRLRTQLAGLPEGTYPTLDAVVETLAGRVAA